MKKRYLSGILLVMMTVACSSFGAEHSKELQFLKKCTPEEISWIKNGLSVEQVKGKIEKNLDALEQDVDCKKISKAQMAFYQDQLIRWRKYYFYEYDTKTKRAWLNDLGKFMVALSTARDKIKELQSNKQASSQELSAWQKNYTENINRTRQLLKQPYKVSDPIGQKELGAQKKAVVDALKEQEQAQGGGQKK